MSTRSIRVVLAIGAVVSAAWLAPACDEGGATNSATAAASTTGTGGSGGSSSSAVSSSSGAMTIMCGSQTCMGYNLAGFADVPACCPATNPEACGIDISIVASFLMLPPGCMELNRPGTLDPSCPTGTLNLMGMMLMLPGCCSGGVCGVMADIGGIAPFGCVDTTNTYTDGGMPPTCTGGTGGAGGAGGGAGGTGGGTGGAGSSTGGAGSSTGGAGGSAGGAGGTGG